MWRLAPLLAGCVAIGDPKPVRVVQGPAQLACPGQRMGCQVPPSTIEVHRGRDGVVIALAPAEESTFAVPPMRCKRTVGACRIDAGVVRADQQSARVRLVANVAEGARTLQLRLHWVSCDRYRCTNDDGLLTVDLQ